MIKNQNDNNCNEEYINKLKNLEQKINVLENEKRNSDQIIKKLQTEKDSEKYINQIEELKQKINEYEKNNNKTKLASNLRSDLMKYHDAIYYLDVHHIMTILHSALDRNMKRLPDEFTKKRVKDYGVYPLIYYQIGNNKESIVAYNKYVYDPDILCMLLSNKNEKIFRNKIEKNNILLDKLFSNEKFFNSNSDIKKFYKPYKSSNWVNADTFQFTSFIEDLNGNNIKESDYFEYLTNAYDMLVSKITLYNDKIVEIISQSDKSKMKNELLQLLNEDKKALSKLKQHRNSWFVSKPIDFISCNTNECKEKVKFIGNYECLTSKGKKKNNIINNECYITKLKQNNDTINSILFKSKNIPNGYYEASKTYFQDDPILELFNINIYT